MFQYIIFVPVPEENVLVDLSVVAYSVRKNILLGLSIECIQFGSIFSFLLAACAKRGLLFSFFSYLKKNNDDIILISCTRGDKLYKFLMAWQPDAYGNEEETESRGKSFHDVDDLKQSVKVSGGDGSQEDLCLLEDHFKEGMKTWEVGRFFFLHVLHDISHLCLDHQCPVSVGQLLIHT